MFLNLSNYTMKHQHTDKQRYKRHKIYPGKTRTREKHGKLPPYRFNMSNSTMPIQTVSLRQSQEPKYRNPSQDRLPPPKMRSLSPRELSHKAVMIEMNNRGASSSIYMNPRWHFTYLPNYLWQVGLGRLLHYNTFFIIFSAPADLIRTPLGRLYKWLSPAGPTLQIRL